MMTIAQYKHEVRRLQAENDRLKAEVQVLREEAQDCEDCPELDRMGQEINDLRKGLNSNYLKGRQLEIERYEKELNMLRKKVEYEKRRADNVHGKTISELKGRVEELEKENEELIISQKARRDKWVKSLLDTQDECKKEIEAKTRVLSVEEIEEILKEHFDSFFHQVHFYITIKDWYKNGIHGTAKAIKSKIDETIGEK